MEDFVKRHMLFFVFLFILGFMVGTFMQQITNQLTGRITLGYCPDVNGDGAVNTIDSLIVAKGALNASFCSSYYCDLNRDGTITNDDAKLVVLNNGKYAYDITDCVAITHFGALKITTDPSGSGTSVYLDGVLKGTTTPLTINTVKAGAHSLKIIKSGYLDYVSEINVMEGQINELSTKLAPPSSSPDSCSDNDGNGQGYSYSYNIFVKGTSSGYKNGAAYSSTDYCIDSNNIMEYYCIGGVTTFSKQTECPWGNCVDGACGTSQEGGACSDTDNGKDFNVIGTCTDIHGSYTDVCSPTPGSVREIFCRTNECAFEDSVCPYGCSDGKCQLQQPVGTCTDSDGGINNFTSGYVSGIDSQGNSFNYPDTCTADVLQEQICSGNTPVTLSGICDYECNSTMNDKCNVPYTAGTCIDSDGGINFQKKGNVTFIDKNGGFYMYKDVCDIDTVIEQYCTKAQSPASTSDLCSVDCINGACLNHLDSCTDSDGYDSSVKGTVTGYENDIYYSKSDVCSGYNNVIEYYCSGTSRASKTITCSGSCVDGACSSSNCRTLNYNGDGYTNHVNIIFVPSGFNGDMTKFAQEAQRAWDKFKNYVPLNNIDNLNVFYVTQEASPNSYCFYNCGGIQRLLCVTDTSIPLELSAVCYSGPRQTVVIHNDVQYGGAGYGEIDLATSSINPSGPDVVVHELGHSLFSLGDEYNYQDGSNPFNSGNCDFSGCNKWADIIGFMGVNCQANSCANGGYYTSENTIMQYLGSPFHEVNERITCCIYQQITGGYPAFCDKFSSIGKGLADYCNPFGYTMSSYSAPYEYTFKKINGTWKQKSVKMLKADKFPPNIASIAPNVNLNITFVDGSSKNFQLSSQILVEYPADEKKMGGYLKKETDTVRVIIDKKSEIKSVKINNQQVS